MIFAIVQILSILSCNARSHEEENHGLGYIDNHIFENDIVHKNSSFVVDDNVWFIYMYHSFCNSKKCHTLNRAFERVYNDWEDLLLLQS